MNDRQMLFNIISVLTARLGGEVVINYDEVENPVCTGTVTRDDHKRTLTIVAKPEATE